MRTLLILSSPVFEDATVGPSKLKPGSSPVPPVVENRDSTYRTPSAAQRAKAAEERASLLSASSQSSPVPSRLAVSERSTTPKPRSGANISGFGRAMLDDEKRTTRAGLLGLDSSHGQASGTANPEPGNQVQRPDVKYWTCPVPSCDTLNHVNRSKCCKCVMEMRLAPMLT